MGGRSAAVVLLCALMCACSHNSAPVFSGEPMTVNVYPVDTTPENPPNPARIFILVTAVGTVQTRLPLAFDTGSSGVTLNALRIFPPSMVGPAGFVFPAGASRLLYKGITVTNQSGKRVYGGADTGRTEIGNLGFTSISFGDQYGIITTAQMPVFLYYAVQQNDSNQPAIPQRQQGWFGVGDTPNRINFSPPPNGVPSLDTCSPETTYSCYVSSPLEYLSYVSGTDAGFVLDAAPLQTCDISTPASCLPSYTLTIGLTPSVESGFVTSPLVCVWPSTYIGPTQVNGYPACMPQIQNSMISLASGSSFVGALWFDTGTPYFAINVPPEASFPPSVPAGAELTFTTPSGFVYTTGVGTGVHGVTVAQASTFPTVVGIGYFTGHQFFIDYSTGSEGWR